MGVVQHKHSKRTPQNHCVPILCKFHLGFCSEAAFKRETESRSTNKLCIALARGSSYFTYLLLKGTYLKKRGLTLFVSSFGGTLDYTLYMNYGIVVIISLHFKTTSKNSYSKLSVWPTNILAEHCAAPKKQAGSGWIHYWMEEYIISEHSLSWPGISSPLSLCYQETEVQADSSSCNPLSGGAQSNAICQFIVPDIIKYNLFVLKQ